jgi:uncharacterized membrane protein
MTAPAQQPDAPSAPNDQDLDRLLGNLLRFGVLLSATVVLTGGIVYLAEHGGEPARIYDDFGAQPEYLRHVATVLRHAATSDGKAIIQLGILLLIGTPIARVVFSVFAFFVQRDYFYVGVTLIVLVVLLFSLLFDG